LSMRFFFLFFQAADGIRVSSVTGVQTCALPISRQRPARARAPPAGEPELEPEQEPSLAPWSVRSLLPRRPVRSAPARVRVSREQIGRASCREREQVTAGAARARKQTT